jgi:beta-galactosidase
MKAILVGSISLSALATFAAPVPLVGDGAPVAVEKLRVDNPAVLPMTGEWKFQIANGREHAGAFEPGFNNATASSEQGEHKAARAFGGKSNSYWCAENGTFPQWWQVDLGEPQTVQALQLVLEDKNFSYQGQIETSDDGTTWTTLADLKTNVPAADGNVTISPTTCRYLRVTFTDGKDDQGDTKWGFIRHIQISILRDGKSVVWKPELNSKEAALGNFGQTDFDDKNFSTISVPANWEVIGFSKPTYDQPDDAVGLYRRVLDVPASFAGQRVWWHFDGVFDTAEIFINGKRAGYHEGGFTAFDLDVTDFIKPGEKNLFAVRVCKNSDSVDMDTGDYWALGGIYRETYLLAVPPTHLDDVKIVTDLTHDYKDADLQAEIKVAGPPGQHFELTGQLYQFDGTKAGTPEIKLADVLDDTGKAVAKLSQTVTSPKLWSAEKPNLYYLVTTLAVDGNIVERTQERFGFKQIEIKGGVLFWNGVPIKLTGTCRHEEWAVSGHALTEDEWQTDVRLLKAANINAIRTSHYIDAQRFLELCEEKGFYVLDEIPFCWADPKKTSYTPAYTERTEEAYARDKNRPCVLAWSMGNESGFGPVNNAGFQRIKELDPTRPAFISGARASDNTNLDLLDFHYPHVDEIKRIAKNKDRETKPAMLTEGPHTIYTTNTMNYDYGVKDFWGQGLLLQWNQIWPVDSMLGAFIWEWQDQGLADKFPGRSGITSDGLRENNFKGYVDGYRNVKPEYFNVKMVYSPVVVGARNFEIVNGNISVSVQNRYSFTDLSELTCRWQAFAGDKVIASGEKQIAAAPRTSGTANFDATPGVDSLRLEFIHPDGRSIYVTRLDVQGLKHPAPAVAKKAAGKVKLKDSGNQIRVATGNAEFVVNKTDGAVVSWTVGGQPLLAGNLILNLGVNREPHREGGEDSRNSLISKQLPQLKNAVVTTKSENNRAVITVSNSVYLVESSEPKGTLVENFTVRPDGQIDVNWQLKWTAAEGRVWELGMELPLPDSLNQMQWRRDGLWTEYPADHIGATQGIAGPDDLTFRCTKRNLEWLTMSAPTEKYAFSLVNDGTPLHSRGRVENGGLFLYASALNAPFEEDLADGMFGDYFVFLKKGKTYTGGFSLRPVAH